ncbi:MAG: hypothetical protein ACM3MK_05690 [Chitinophagales bacterium]
METRAFAALKQRPRCQLLIGTGTPGSGPAKITARLEPGDPGGSYRLKVKSET